jgi:hypothetical protein
MSFRQMVLLVLIALALPFLVLPRSAWSQELAQEAVSQCPAEYPRRSVKLPDMPKGWMGKVNFEPKLQSAGIIQGNPFALGELAPISEYKKDGKTFAYFSNFPEGSQRDVYLSCNYGYLGEIQLFKKLPVTVKQCTFQYKDDTENHILVLESLTCS